MMYADESYYTTEYGGKMVPSADFGRLARRAGRIMDVATRERLRHAFPEDEYTVTAVKDCQCALIEFLYQVEQYQNFAMQSNGVVTDEQGVVRGKIVSSITSGSESVGYSTGGNSISTSAADAAKSEQKFNESTNRTIRSYLSGLKDSHGHNLLFSGIGGCL